jgi:hypothetical protein
MSNASGAAAAVSVDRNDRRFIVDLELVAV